VAHAKQLLRHADIRAAKLKWIEDVRKWHPAQDWIWQAGGLGVFDPGINGLSILTEVISENIRVSQSKLMLPANKHAPIAAHLELMAACGWKVDVELDWRVAPSVDKTECWQMEFETNLGIIELINGGAVCLNNGEIVFEDKNSSLYAEYESIYRDFAKLIKDQKSSVDLVPLQLVADSFMLADTTRIEAFHD
jgi:hypothetical protein